MALLVLSSGDSGATYRHKLSAAFAPLDAANRSLSTSLSNLNGSDAHGAQDAAVRAQRAALTTRGALATLTVPSGYAQTSSQAAQALDREDSYLAAVRTTLAHPSNPGVSQLQALSGNLTAALDAVGTPLAGASQAVTGADGLVVWAQHAAAHQSQPTLNSSSSTPPQQSAPPSAAPSDPYANGRDCGGGLYAGPNTSCDFAANVRAAYDAAPGTTTTINVYSPVTDQTYAMFCTPAGAGVTCSGGNDASVSW